MEASDTVDFDAFAKSRAKSLWYAAWLLTGDHHKAEDLVQTALAKTFSRFTTMDTPAFEAYVRTTIYRTFVSWWRKLSWRNEKPTETHADAPTPDSQSTLRIDLVRALDELPRMQRAVLVLQYFEDLSVEEIARELGVTTGTVKTHSSRGRASPRTSAHLIESGVSL